MTLESKLQNLVASQPNYRSQAARIRAHYPAIQAALAKGISRTAVLEVLKSEGIELSLQSFEKILYRIRKAERDQAASKTDSNPVAAGKIPPTVKPANTQEPVPPAKHSSPVGTDFRKLREETLANTDWVSLSQPQPVKKG